jgi:hypothetical protein
VGILLKSTKSIVFQGERDELQAPKERAAVPLSIPNGGYIRVRLFNGIFLQCS